MIETLQTKRLQELEQKIEAGLQTFVEVGKALMEIRDSRLYLENHNTFEDYIKVRWGWTRDWAYKQIAAAEVIGNVDTCLHRGQASMLAPLSPEDQRALAPVIAPLTVREAREIISQHKMGVHYSSETDDWSTPQNLFDVLNQEFKFDLDVCASGRNAKCETFYDRESDGLVQPWIGTCWMNPPYGGEISQWVEKAWKSSQDGATVVCLLPARVDTGWWWDYCRFGEIRFLRGRLRFGNADSGAPFPSAVVIFPRTACVRWWEWQPD